MIDQVRSTIAWLRQPFPNTGKASYVMLADEKRTGWTVQWCGHPTALRPYYITGPRGTEVPAEAFRSSKDARRIAEELYAEAQR